MFEKSYRYCIIFTAFISQTCLCVPLDFFFPFGENANDTEVAKSDDGFISLPLSREFVFYNRSHTILFVSFVSLRSVAELITCIIIVIVSYSAQVYRGKVNNIETIYTRLK